MRALIQRVSKASITSLESPNGNTTSISRGLCILVGFEENDCRETLEQMSQKITKLRIFSDESGKMNLSGEEVGAEYLIVSQFTLFSDTRHGNRPSFTEAAPKEKALKYYELFVNNFSRSTPKNMIKSGPFGAYLAVELINDGPVTIWLDSKEFPKK